MADRRPALLAVAHGTRDPAGAAVARDLLGRVRAMRPGLRVAGRTASWRSRRWRRPRPRWRGPVVVVPLLLGRGYHALIDIPERAARLLPGAVASRPLGPDPLLADVLAGRLAECTGTRIPPRRPDAVVLGAAGSADPAGATDVRAAAQLLARRLRRPVTCGFVAAGGPALEDAVARLRRRGARRVAVASYLLAPGRFLDRMRACGADAVTAPIGAHDAAARLVLRRYDEARSRTSEPVPVG